MFPPRSLPLLSLSLLTLSLLALAEIPSLPGYRLTWSDDFNGPSGASVDLSAWYQHTQLANSNPNNERQEYRAGTDNAHLSGDGQLYIIPKKDAATGQWTSANLQSYMTFHCPAGKAMRLQAEIAVPDFSGGGGGRLGGLWPAFWTLGKAFRDGVPWPKCGEWDIMETTNRLGSVNQATLHFARPDNQYQDDGSHHGQVWYGGGEYHTWAVEVDRRHGNWREQRIAFLKDGDEYFGVSGADIGNFDQWVELAYKSYFAILNVAVGGNFAGGDPPEEAVGGWEAAMRVKYVASYESL